MDYSRIYNSLISYRISNPLKKSNDLYTEVHHIVPKCLGGSDNHDNLIRLTIREHFLAHRFLSKMYPDITGLSLAVYLMIGGSGHRNNLRVVTSRESARLRKMAIEAHKQWWDDNPEYKRKMSSMMSSLNKERWAEDIYREDMSHRLKMKWEEPEFRKLITKSLSDLAKRRWLDQKYRDEFSSKIKAKWQDPKFREEGFLRMSSKAIKQWEDPDFRKYMSEKVSKTFLSKFLPDSYKTDDPKHKLWELADVLYVHSSGGYLSITLPILLRFGITNIASSYANPLLQRFRNGWIPLEDARWIEYVDKRLKLLSQRTFEV